MPDKQTTSSQTTVSEIDLDIDSWLNAPGSENVITPEKEEIKPNFFSKETTDLKFLDEEEPETKEEGDKVEDHKEVIDNLDKEETEEEKKAGRPKTDKSGLTSFLKKRIESEEMFAFNDYDESKQTLDEYLDKLSEKDTEDLWSENLTKLKEDLRTEIERDFDESLPEELQYATAYVKNGGKDLKGLFQALAAVEQVREMDPSVEDDQEHIVRQYLQATGFGNAEEIEEELTTWKDLGNLEKKAKQFKPKLDQMQEKIVKSQLAEQETKRRQQEAAAENYVQSVFEALRPAEINGIKLDKKTQATLYSGLVQPQYPSISGRPTNLLGHLLEKYQFVEPNYPLIAEALWLLSDPKEYRQSIATIEKTKSVATIARGLKTEQSNKKGNGGEELEDNSTKTRKLVKPTNIFQR